MPDTIWVPLHVHSQYSILDATAPVDKIAAAAAEDGMPAVALTDHGNLYGAVDFFKKCSKEGVKPIIGCDLYEAPESRHDKKRIPGKRAGYSLVLLAKDDTGYHSLCKLSSYGYLEGFYYYPRIDRELLEQYHGGLICLSGGLGGKVAQVALEGNKEALIEEVEWYRTLFGDDYFLELQRHQMAEETIQAHGMAEEGWLLQQYHDYVDKQQRANELLVEVGRELGIPLIAANDSHYMAAEDWKAHEILLNVQSGEPCEIWEVDAAGNPKFRIPNPKRKTYSSHELYFKTQEQMAALFADLPEALENTLKIAERCNLELDFKSTHYPVFEAPSLEGKEYTSEERVAAAEQYLEELCEEGIPQRYTSERLKKVGEIYPGKEPMDVVRERLSHEMSVITSKGMCDYLLIVGDFIKWAKSRGIPVGPGRGSGAGSIINYLIGITDIEPLRFSLFFERFINPERPSYPDLDIDICMDRRPEVIAYMLDKYGKDNCAQIITFGTMKARSSIKDVGRVLSVPLAKVNAIAKLVPEDLGITLDAALEKDVDLLNMYNSDDDAKRIIDLGRKLEGSVRNTGIHAAGLIVAGDRLVEHIPITVAKDADMPVTQYSMKPVESVGMLKIDFLGLKTLTSIQTCVEAIKARHDVDIDWSSIPLDDKKTFALLNHGKTMGVFQMESGGMQDLARQLHLDLFEEIIAVLSLYRPGPMDMIPSFIARKHGREKIESDHPWMDSILSETYGIMVYQEQVMQIAQKLANYSLGEGDVLRRAMGKKDMQEMTRQREKFLQGARDNHIDETTAGAVFDKMEKFASYGFNKSHAAAYGYLTYVTAYLKAHYPAEWMAALMTCDRDDLTKVAKFIAEAQAMGIAILPPDVNESTATFTATDAGIRFAMGGIRGVGTGVVEAIMEERKKSGSFKTLYDFFTRIDTSRVGKKVADSLVQAGAFDFTGWSRDQLRISCDPMFDAAASEQKDRRAGNISLFSLIEEGGEGRFAEPPSVKHSSTAVEILLKEKEMLGFFVTGHPLKLYEPLLSRLSYVSLQKALEMDANTVFRTAFIIDSCAVRFSSRTQKKFAILIISDGVSRYELPIWAELFEEKGHLLQENQLLYAVLQVDERDGEKRFSCRWLDDLTKANEAMVEECDRAFDRAKLMASRPRGNGKKKEEQKAVEKQAAQPQEVVVELDSSTMKMSDILTLKSILDEHGGPTPIKLQFNANGKPHAILHLEGGRGVNRSPELNKGLKTLEAVVNIQG